MNFSEIFPGVIFSQFTPDGLYLVLSNGSKIIVKEVDQLNSIPFQHSSFQDAPISQIEVSPDSQLIAISYPKRSYVEIRKINEPTWIAKIEDSVEQIIWCPDSVQLIVVSEFQIKATIYNFTNKTSVHFKNPKQINFSNCKKFMAMIERRDGKDVLQIFDIKFWKLHAVQNCDTLDSAYIAWSHDDSLIAVQDTELNFKINLHCPCQGQMMKFEPYQYALGIRISRFAKQSDQLALGSHDEKLRIINLLTLRLIAELEHKITRETQVFKEEEFVDQHYSRVVTRYSQVDSAVKLPSSKANTGVSQLEWSYRDEYIATKNDNFGNCVFIWEVDTLTLKCVLIQLQPVKQFLWSKNSSHLTVCCGNSKIFFWTPQTTSVCDMPFDKSFHVNRIEWSYDQKSLLLQDKSDVILVYPQAEETF